MTEQHPLITRTVDEGLATELSPPQPTRKKLAYYLGLIIIAVATVIAMVYLYWALQASHILTINNAPNPVIAAKLDGERVALVTIDYCKANDSEANFTYSFVSSSTILAAPSIPAGSVHGCSSKKVPIPVPKQAIADKYHIHFKAVYKVNPIRTSTTEWDTQSFNIPME